MHTVCAFMFYYALTTGSHKVDGAVSQVPTGTFVR